MQSEVESQTMPQCCFEIKVMLKLLQREGKAGALVQSSGRISTSPCGFPSEEDVGLITSLDLVERGLDFYLNPWRPSVPRTLSTGSSTEGAGKFLLFFPVLLIPVLPCMIKWFLLL